MRNTLLGVQSVITRSIAIAAIFTTSYCVVIDEAVQIGWLPGDGMDHTLPRATTDISAYAVTRFARALTTATTGDEIIMLPGDFRAVVPTDLIQYRIRGG